MKRLFAIFLFILISFSFNSCLKDVVLKKYTYFTPVYSLKEEVRANVKSGAPQSIVNPGKIYVQGKYIFISDAGKGIHIIDYSQPSAPQNLAFIPIPGNENLAVKGNYLYADEYTDLLTIDISNPLQAKLVNSAPNAFPEQYYYQLSDTDYIVTSWKRVDTMIKSNETVHFYPYPVYVDLVPYSNASAPKADGGGTGGSMARFAIVNNRLYTVSYADLKVFNLEAANKPAFVQTVTTSTGDIETIYPFQNNLFLGSSSGMHIYDVSNADAPSFVSNFAHVRACDPVIADENTAYVTLRSGTVCQGFTNQLDVLNTTDIVNPALIQSYSFTNPRGLAKDGDNLFICDGADGLKILNAASATDIQLIKTVTGFEANDVIADNHIAIVIAADGLYLVDYSDINNPFVTGKIQTAK